VMRNRGRPRAAVSLTVENRWGRFNFEAEPLAGVDPSVPSTILVTICHDEPRAVALRRALDALPLSVVQKEVCKLLHGGYTRGEIAKALAIAPSTVADHVKKVYGKLDVHSTSELRHLLDSVGTGAAA
jgi:DNA-binding CsgD family transcriptional regulator